MTSGTKLASAAAACLAIGLIAAPSFAASVGFQGALQANGAPVSFDAAKKNGRYRTVKRIAFGDSESTGIPGWCEGIGNVQFTVPPDSFTPISVHRNGSFSANDGLGDDVAGKFVSNRKAKGTVEVHYTLYDPEPHYCQTQAPQPWTAKTSAG